MAQILPFPSEAGQTTKSPLAYFVGVGEAHNKLLDLYVPDRLTDRLRDQSARLAKLKITLETLHDLGSSDMPRVRAARFRAYSEARSRENKK